MRKLIKKILKEGVDDFDWIKDTESGFNPKFPFDGQELWLDLTNIDVTGKIKIVDYIKKVLPNYIEKEINGLNGVKRNNIVKGIVIHCATDDNDFKPKKNALCFSLLTYEEDYDDQDSLNIPNVYIDGRDVLFYIKLFDEEEELDESLEWSDKDNSFIEKDKNFENDPTWEVDDSWVPNPDRSYWKQGDVGGTTPDED